MKKFIRSKVERDLSEYMKSLFHYRYVNEPDYLADLAGFAFYEYDDNVATKQIEIHSDGFLSSTFGFLTDAPLYDHIYAAEDVITEEEFNKVWNFIEELPSTGVKNRSQKIFLK